MKKKFIAISCSTLVSFTSNHATIPQPALMDDFNETLFFDEQKDLGLDNEKIEEIESSESTQDPVDSEIKTDSQESIEEHQSANDLEETRPEPQEPLVSDPIEPETQEAFISDPIEPETQEPVVSDIIASEPTSSLTNEEKVSEKSDTQKVFEEKPSLLSTVATTSAFAALTASTAYTFGYFMNAPLLMAPINLFCGTMAPAKVAHAVVLPILLSSVGYSIYDLGKKTWKKITTRFNF